MVSEEKDAGGSVLISSSDCDVGGLVRIDGWRVVVDESG